MRNLRDVVHLKIIWLVLMILRSHDFQLTVVIVTKFEQEQCLERMVLFVILLGLMKSPLLVYMTLKYDTLQLYSIKCYSHQVWIAGRPRETISIEANLKCNVNVLIKQYLKRDYYNDYDDDDRWLLRNGWPTQGVSPYFQSESLLEIFTISNLQHAASKIWACAEPEVRLCWMKLCSKDNHYIMVP